MDEKKFVKNIYFKSLLPVTFAVLLVQMCSVINSLLVGNFVGKDGLAVMSIVSPVGFVFATIGSLLAVGGSIQASYFVGKNDKNGCDACLYSAIKFMAIAGILFTVLMIILVEPLMLVLKVPDSIKYETKRYLIAFAPSAFAAMAIYVPFNFFKINGIQKYAVYINFIMLVVNLSLDFLLSGVLGMGMLGIGIATTVAYWASALPGVILLYTKKGGFLKPEQKLDFDSVKNMVISGSPSAINNLSNLLRAFCLNIIILNALGKDGLSVFSIVTTIFSFSVIITNGTSLNMASYAAVFSSEKDTKSLKQVFYNAMLAAIILMSVFVLLVEIFPKQICLLFSIKDAALIAKCEYALRIFSISLIFCGINTIFSTFYQSIKKTFLSNMITFLRGFVFVILFAFLLTNFGDREQIWFAFLIAEVLTLLITLLISYIWAVVKPYTEKFLLYDTKYEKEGRFLAFSVNNDNASVTECAQQITEFCENNDLSPKLTMAIGLAIEEILVSFNDHALNKMSDDVSSNVRILIMPDVIVLRFRLVGELFNPLEYANDNDDLMSDAMGIKMIQKMAEVVMYDRVFGVNTLTILF